MTQLEVPLDDPKLPLVDLVRALVTSVYEAHLERGGTRDEFVNALEIVLHEIQHHP